MYSIYLHNNEDQRSLDNGEKDITKRNVDGNVTTSALWTKAENDVANAEQFSKNTPGKKRILENKSGFENGPSEKDFFNLGECCRIWKEHAENNRKQIDSLHKGLKKMRKKFDSVMKENVKLKRVICDLEMKCRTRISRVNDVSEGEFQSMFFQTETDEQEFLREREMYRKQKEESDIEISNLTRERDNALHRMSMHKKEAEESKIKISTFKRERDTARQDAQGYKKQVEEANMEISKLSRELNEHISQEQNSISTTENELRLQKLETDKHSLTSELHSLSSELEHFKRLNREVREENDRYKRQINELDKAKNDALSRQQLETDMYSLRSNLEHYTKLNREVTEENDRYKREIDNLVEAKNDALSRVQTLETDIQSLEFDREQLKSLNRNVTEENNGYNQQINDSVQAKNVTLTRVQKLETDIQYLKSEVEQLKRLNRKVTEEKDRCKRQINDLNKAKDDALTRLSKVAGAKLTHGNAAITDLSDDNRPTKIAEKFSELYDNAWTDAFEDIESLGIDEKECIHLLLSVLKRTFELCTQVEEKYEARILHAVQTIPCVPQSQTLKELTVQTNIQVVKSLCEIRLSMENVCSLAVEKMVVNILPDLLQTLSSKFDGMNLPSKLLDYTRSCARLCWLMRIRDPPLHLQFDIRRDDAFNQEYFRQYTKSGKKVDFIVWPVLFLHTNGPLLSKGVAQPK